MPDVQGFEVVFEASERALRTVVQSIWIADPDAHDHVAQGTIPASITLPPGLALAGYALAGGQVQIPQEDLAIRMWPAGNGVELTLGLNIHVALQHPPVPAAAHFAMRAAVSARIPLEPGGVGQRQVIARVHDLPRAHVQPTLISGDPLAQIIETLLSEFVHQSYADPDPSRHYPPDFPHMEHTIGPVDITWQLGLATFGATVYAEIYDDPDDPEHAITTRFAGDSIEISIPAYIRIDDIRPALMVRAIDLQLPMAIETRVVISAPFEMLPGRYRARLSAPKTKVEAVRPAPGPEGENYTFNMSKWSPLERVIHSQIRLYSRSMARQAGDISIDVPSVAEIETLIGDICHYELVRRQSIAFWTPDLLPAGFTVKDFVVRALPDALAIALNAREDSAGAALANFIPAERDFAAAINGEGVQRLITHGCADMGYLAAIQTQRRNGERSAIILTRLDIALIDQAIRVQGTATVLHTFSRKLAIDARFRAAVGLRWAPHDALTADGAQRLEPNMPGNPQVHPYGIRAFWVIVVIVAIIAYGAMGWPASLIIGAVALGIRLITAYIGNHLVTHSVSKICRSMTALPPDLMQIGQARAICRNPVVIDPSGIIIAGDFDSASAIRAMPDA